MSPLCPLVKKVPCVGTESPFLRYTLRHLCTLLTDRL